ncbi:MAG: hypothetical protein Q8R16_03655 [bacterium]|nr:hypothetical protein [bacterium]
MGRTYGSPDEFLRERLSEVIGGKTTLGALFATYNEVSGHPSGVVTTGKPGLTVLVQNGSLQYSNASYAALFFGERNLGHPLGDAIGMMGVDMQRHEARVAQASVVQHLGGVRTALGDAPVFSVVYAGYAAFHESVEFARALRADIPHAHVAVVTCTCDHGRKAPILGRAISDGAIEDAIFTAGCGGDRAMCEILETLVAAWPNGPQA